MNNKKRIGIDINEVLRALWQQFDTYYMSEFGEDNAPEESEAYTMDFWNKYHWKDKVETIKYLNEDLPDNISPKDYQVNPKTGEAPVDFLAFKPKTEIIPARDVYKRFLYEDYCLEIFGHSSMMYRNEDRDIEKFFLKYKDQFEISIISKENWFTISPTLFFLSKISTRIKNFHFVEENNEIWNYVDILITTDPEKLNNVPEGKEVIKIIRPFNNDIIKNFEAYNIIDLVETYIKNDKGEIIETKPNIIFDNLIGYIEPIKYDFPEGDF